jgi:glyoxalase family protein
MSDLSTLLPEHSRTSGIHHITAIAGDPQSNLLFYTDALGLRLVKKTVNFDDPGTYHLYYGDATGSPGTILTFFPFPGAKSGSRGAGEASQTAFAIPEASLSFWLNRLAEKGIAHDAPVTRLGEKVIAFSDPDGMVLELVAQSGAGEIAGYAASGIPAEHAIRAFAGVTLVSAKPEATGAVLALMGYRIEASGDGITRWSTGRAGTATRIDVKDAGQQAMHRQGAGTVHHVAFRAADDAAQAAMAEAIRASGLGVTEQRDRQYFRSVYFREPGGILFEIATDDPGFAVDEPVERLGQSLRLPHWLETRRTALEAALPPLGQKDACEEPGGIRA